MSEEKKYGFIEIFKKDWPYEKKYQYFKSIFVLGAGETKKKHNIDEQMFRDMASGIKLQLTKNQNEKTSIEDRIVQMAEVTKVFEDLVKDKDIRRLYFEKKK